MSKVINILIKNKEKRNVAVIIILSLVLFLTILQLVSKLFFLSILSSIAFILLGVWIIYYILKLIEAFEYKPISFSLSKFRKDKAYKNLLNKGIIENHHLLPFIRTKCFDDLLTNVKEKNNIILVGDSGWGKTKLIIELLKELSNDRIFSKEYKKVFFWRGEAETDIPIVKGLYVCKNIGSNIDAFCKLATELGDVGGIFIATIFPEDLYDKHRWVQSRVNYIPIDAYPIRNEWKQIAKIILEDFKKKGLDMTSIEQIINGFSGSLIPPLQLYYSLSRAIERGIDINTENELHSIVEVEHGEGGERKDIEGKIIEDFSESLLYAIVLVTWLTNRNYAEEEIIRTAFIDFLNKEKHQYDVALKTLSGSDIFYILKKVGRTIYISDYHLNVLKKYWRLEDYIDELQSLMKFLDTKIQGERRARFWINLGDRFAEIKDYNKALDGYKEAYNKTHNIVQKGILCIKIGEVYATKQLSEQSLQNYNKAIELFESIQKPTADNFYYLANVYEKKGDIFVEMGDLDNAIDSYERTLDIYSTISKIDFARLSTKVAKILEKLFFISKRKDILEKSIGHAKNAKKCYSELNIPSGVAKASGIIGTCLSLLDISSDRNIGEKAVSYFQYSLNLADKVIDRITKIDIYLEIGEICFGLCIGVIPTKLSIMEYENPILSIGQEGYRRALDEINYVLKNKNYFLKILRIREDEYKEKMRIISQRLGDVCTKRGDFENALNYYNDILKVLEAIDAHEEIGEIYTKIGKVHYLDDKYDKAIEALVNAEREFSLTHNNVALAHIYNQIMYVYLNWKKYKKAKPYVTKLDNIINVVENLLTKASGYLRMGDVSRLLNRYKEAKKYYEYAEKCLIDYPHKEEIDYISVLAYLYTSLGWLSLSISSFKETETSFIKSYELYLKLPNEEYNAGILAMALGNLYRSVENIKKSNKYFEKALGIFRKINKKSMGAECLFNLGINHMISGDYQKAKRILQEGLESSEDKAIQLRINMMLSKVYRGLKDYFSSKKHLDDAMRIWKEHYYLDNIFILLDILEELGDLYFEEGHYEEARRFYKDFINKFKEEVGEKELPNLERLAKLCEKIGKTYYVEQRPDKGSKWYKIARNYWFKAEGLSEDKTIEAKLHIFKNIVELSEILNDKKVVENYRKKIEEILPASQPIAPIRIYKPRSSRLAPVKVISQNQNCMLCGSSENTKECPESHIIYCRKCCKEEIKCGLYQECWKS